MNPFKNSISLLLLIFFVATACAQKKSKRPSPPAQVTETIGDVVITVDYSRPSKKGRTIFGGLEEFGKVWRTGANEATWISFSKDVKVQGESIAAGKYGLFTIPDKQEWTIIFNSEWDQWGAYEYDAEKDVLRVKAPSTQTSEVIEVFDISISNQGEVSIAWDQTMISFSVTK